MSYKDRRDFSVLLGKTLTGINVSDDYIIFTTSEGDKYRQFHDQNCCESVYIDDICGDVNDLLHSPILLAEEVSNYNDPPKDTYNDSYTWTFYKLSTNKGSATIRWYGTSNGYYSESVEFEQL